MSSTFRSHIAVAMLLLVTMVTFTTVAVAQDQIPSKDAVAEEYAKQKYSPYVGREYPTRVFWGETHLHTAVSVDAGTMCTVGQEDLLCSPLRYLPYR